MKNQEVIDLWEAYNQIYESAAGGIVGTAPKSPVAKPAVRGIKKPVPAPEKVSENQEFEMWVNSLVEEGYDLSEYTWDDMYEMYVNAGENESDLFDYILEYLVAEGYADTNENALVIMANMSEDWRESIVEAVSGGSYYDLPGVVIRAASGAASKLLNRGQPPAAKPKPHPSDSKLVDVSTADKAAKNLPGSRVYRERQQQQSR